MAALTLGMAEAADAGIGCYEPKYAYNFWRPITAIRFAASDGNRNRRGRGLDSPIDNASISGIPFGPPVSQRRAARALAINFGVNTAFSVDAEVSPAPA